MQEKVKKLRYPLLLVSSLLTALGVVYPQSFGIFAWVSLIPAGLVLLTLGGKAKSGSMYLYGFVFYLLYYVMGYHWFISMYPPNYPTSSAYVFISKFYLKILLIKICQRQKILRQS